MTNFRGRWQFGLAVRSSEVSYSVERSILCFMEAFYLSAPLIVFIQDCTISIEFACMKL